ncbi:MAG: Mrp/NBP35 family ATP-binding protein [Acidimicrobiia bacterium]
MVDRKAVQAAIEAIEDPELRRPITELGMLRELEVARKGSVRAVIALPTPQASLREDLERQVADAAKAIDGVGEVAVDFTVMTEEERDRLAELLRGSSPAKVSGAGSRTRVIAVASGKGGVGKSSVTANLAVALAIEGHAVGVIDADVWGYSIPKMLGLDRPPTSFGQMIIPSQIHGVRVISMDFFVGPEQAVVWRGPMLHKAVEQFLGDVFWDDPEFLLVDMPPGTGDVAISLSQFLPRSQALIVTTPQITAQRVAKRAALMAQKVNQEVLGVVENMSWFTGDDGVRYSIFGSGGGQALADDLGVPLLGQVPLVTLLREAADSGTPVAVVAPDSEAAEAFGAIATKVVELRPRVRTHPELVIS